MSFEKEFKTYLIKSNKNVSEISLINGVSLNNYDNKFNIISSKKIISGSQSFVDTYFDIDENDSIYGLINSKRGSLIYIYSNDQYLIKTNILSFNGRKNSVKFPYIKKFPHNIIHVFFYLVNVSKTNYCTLFHFYYDGTTWYKSTISTLNYFLLTNFSVSWDKDIPTVFFLKKFNNCSEIFLSTFNLVDKKWTEAIPITMTKREKVYLSILKTTNKQYHITFAENNNNKYYCMYFNEAADNISVLNHQYIHLNKKTICSFPNLLVKNSTLYLQWIEGTVLLTCKSQNSGKTWSTPLENKQADFKPFYRCQYNSNNKAISYPSIFYTFKKPISPII